MKKVHAFLGFTEYYRGFVKNYARIAIPPNDLLVKLCSTAKSKGKKTKVSQAVLKRTELEQTAFHKLKEKFANPPVLAYADYRQSFNLHTDASNSGVGTVLYQNQGLDRVIAYASKSLKPAEKNYPAHKLEFLALTWAVTEKFHDYLNGTKFETVTDNNVLTYTRTSAKLDITGKLDPNGKLDATAKLNATLGCCSVNLQLRPDILVWNKNADADRM